MKKYVAITRDICYTIIRGRAYTTCVTYTTYTSYTAYTTSA